jgi:adenylate cyclase
MDLYRGLRSPPRFWPILLLLSASAYHRAGQVAEGLRQLDAAAALVTDDTAGPLRSEFEIAKGDLIALGGGGDSEALYRSAFDSARALSARMPQLRAATRLARGWRIRGDSEAIVRTLGPVYDSFDEGLATADLRDAREALAAVAPTRYPPRD